MGHQDQFGILRGGRSKVHCLEYATKTNNPKLWKFVPDQLWHKSWNIPPSSTLTQRHITRCLGVLGCGQQIMAFKCKFCAFFSSDSYIVQWKGCKLNLLAPVDATMNWNWIFYSSPSLPPASHPWMNSIALTCALVLSIGVVFNLPLYVVLKYSLWCTVLGV